MKMKKILALLLTGALTFSMSMVAFAETPVAVTEETEGDGESDNGEGKGTEEEGDKTEDEDPSSAPAPAPEKKKSKPTAAEILKAKEEAEVRTAEAEAAVESQANALAAEAVGLSMETLSAAAEAGKSVGEYFNNAVTETPGLENTAPVAQGGGVIINGEVSNQSFEISKPVLAKVESAKTQAAALGGSVLNVVEVDGAVSFDTATVNFYMPGLTGAEKVQVCQYADGQWNAVTVAEIRADHVVVDMTAYGTLAFIQVQ